MSIAAEHGCIEPGIDFGSLENQENPYPIYEHLRESHPVCRLKSGDIWAVSRYDDVRFALERPDLFSSAGLKTLTHPDWITPECRRDLFVLMLDPPEHNGYRALANKAFNGRAVKALTDFIRRQAEALVKSVGSNKTVEFIDDFAFPYTGKIISHIVGIEGDHSLREIRRWLGLIGKITPVRPSDAEIQEFESAILEQNARFDAIILDRRNSPRDDFVSTLVHEEVNGEKLSDSMLRNALDIILHAGFHTTLHALCQSIAFLSRRPDIRSLLTERPSLIPAFIEELLRLHTPAPAVFRQTTKPVVLSGTIIPDGAKVLLILASANRDPRQFGDADEFDINRENIKDHLAFGHGHHICLGAALARLELKIALETILAAFNSFSCPPDSELSWTKSAVVRGVEELPVSLSHPEI